MLLHLVMFLALSPGVQVGQADTGLVRISGTVVDPAGNPVNEAEVRVVATPSPDSNGKVGKILERISPSDIEMMEIFRGPGELPGEFNNGNCGAISIWTRQGRD